MGHELRNPLATIKGYVQLLRRRQAYDEESVEAALAQIYRLERLLNDLIDAARAGSHRLALRPGEVDLGALVVGAASEAQALTARQTVRAEVPAEPVTGPWDADRLSQVLQNLLGNAIKYAPDNTEIVARVERDRETGEPAVSIVDQGPGVPVEALSHLFERFYRAPAAKAADTGEATGLGLGLYVSRMLVEAHGGHLWAERAGAGTAFRFTLPAEPARDQP